MKNRQLKAKNFLITITKTKFEEYDI